MKYFMMILCMAAMWLPAGQALAVNADTGLYDPAPPPGSAFVRFLSAYQKNGSNESKINGKTLEYVDFGEVSSYFVAPKGKTDIVVGKARESADLAEGGYYTVILKNENDIEVVADPLNDNLSKAQIIFYNLMPGKTLSLKTSGGNVDIVPSVAAGKSGSRQLNPVNVPVAVYDEDRILRDLGGLPLERGRSYSVVAYPDNAVRQIASTTNTER